MSIDPLSTSSTTRRLATRALPADAEHPADFGIEVAGLNHWYISGDTKHHALVENNLQITRGEIVIMTGPSGSGKTTLLTLIGGLRTIQEGEIRLRVKPLDSRNGQTESRALSQLSSSQLVHLRRDIGFIFQTHNLFPSLTSYQNVRMAMELREMPEGEMRRRAVELLSTLGLDQRVDYKPESLSIGQRQRVAICRALVNRPSLVLADEPTASLDEKSGHRVFELFKQFSTENKTTVLIVTHDKRILDMADRIVNMVDGKIISDVLPRLIEEVTQFLRHCPLFRELTPSTVAGVAEKVSVENHSAGDVIVRQGEPGDKFYVIHHGHAEVLKQDESPGQLVATLKEGDFFGELALLNDQPRSATVVAKDPLELYVLSKEDFLATIRTSEPFDKQLRKAIFERQ
ncbi:MAG TPA: ATP-binding cassette domain-containing protein [Pirellulales bacterium]